MATLGELAELVGGEVCGDQEMEIIGVAGLEDAKPGMISLVAAAKMISLAKMSQASAYIFPDNLEELDLPGIRVRVPRLAFAKILRFFYPKPSVKLGVDPSAVVGERFTCGPGCSVGPLVYIGKDVTFGENVIIHPGAVIGDRVTIGDDSEIYANVTIMDSTEIGERVSIHSGTVIGADGFGYVTVEGAHHKVPQIGKVVIESDVEIGANVTIDRATTGATLIRRGTKIDNIVQIAHNVEVGEDNIIVSMAGIAGSARLGDRVTLAGQSGVIGHITIGSNTVVAARGMVIGSLPENSFVSGQPARAHSEDMRIQAAAGRLPDLLKTVRNMEKRLAKLEKKSDK